MAEGFTIASAMTAASGIFEGVLSVLTGNPIFVALIGAALIPIGFRLFKSAKNTVG